MDALSTSRPLLHRPKTWSTYQAVVLKLHILVVRVGHNILRLHRRALLFGWCGHTWVLREPAAALVKDMHRKKRGRLHPDWSHGRPIVGTNAHSAAAGVSPGLAEQPRPCHW